MKVWKYAVLLMFFVFAGALAQPAQVSADTDPTLAPVLIGNWQYFYSGTVMGTILTDARTQTVVQLTAEENAQHNKGGFPFFIQGTPPLSYF